jgi:D-aminoacyl-tRNA deacylase
MCRRFGLYVDGRNELEAGLGGKLPVDVLRGDMLRATLCARGSAQARRFVIALLQRVSRAGVEIAGEERAAIGRGLLVLIGVTPNDDEARALKLLERLLNYRVFADEAGKMNLSLRQIGGSLMLVPQFTLAADTRHGLRPGFSGAAPPDQGRRLFDFLVQAAGSRHSPVESGVFGADMQVSLTNDGPVTLWLES